MWPKKSGKVSQTFSWKLKILIPLQAGVGLGPPGPEVLLFFLESMTQKTIGSDFLGVVEVFTEVKYMYDVLLVYACLLI